MLREDALNSVQATTARSERIPSVPDARAVHLEARRLRADVVRHLWQVTSAFVGDLFRMHHLTVPAHRIDVVRGH
jgi:hypothetical protein